MGSGGSDSTGLTVLAPVEANDTVQLDDVDKLGNAKM
jgi:hypothetical protein